MFRENYRFSKNSVSKAVLSPTWTILGRFCDDFGSKNAPQKHPKTTKKRTKKQHEKRTKKTPKKDPNMTNKT